MFIAHVPVLVVRKGATWLDDNRFHPTVQKDEGRRLNTEHSVARSSIDLARPLSPLLEEPSA